MRAAGAARLLADGVAWRLSGAARAGTALVNALTGGDETEQTIAAMMLVRAGDRSVKFLTERLLAGGAPDLVDVLTSIGTEKAKTALRRIAQSTEPTVGTPIRKSAAEALRTLDEIDRHGRTSRHRAPSRLRFRWWVGCGARGGRRGRCR